MLREKGELDSGFVALSDLRERARAALRETPACDDGGLTSDSPLDARIRQAISPLDGATTGLTKKVADRGKLSYAVQRAIASAEREIEAREFPGTDYVAVAEGVVAIRASCFSAEVIAYAVWGGGSGSPDYGDGLVYAIGLDGRRLFVDEDSF